MDLARRGDSEAFGALVEPYLRELQAHCYRILGATVVAEDALQETLLSAWRGLSGFGGQASLRSWLFRVATNRCLDVLRAWRRRSRVEPVMLDVGPPEPTRYGEVLWLQPYPDVLLQGVIDQTPGPEARYSVRVRGRRSVLGRPERGESQRRRQPGTRFELSVHPGPAPFDKQVEAGTRPAR